jgi:hypothetical protein
VPAKQDLPHTLSRQQNCQTGIFESRFSFAASSEVEAFGPAAFISVVHPGLTSGRSRGNIVFGVKREKTWLQKRANGGKAICLAETLIESENGADVYVTMHLFKGPRTANKLAALGCCFSDIDYRNIPTLVGASLA